MEKEEAAGEPLLTTKFAIILDIDGTISNSSHREHLARSREWDEFHAACVDDAPHEDVLRIVNILAHYGYRIIALTGRPEPYRTRTLDWLAKHGADVEDLLMRPEKNFDPDIVVKPALLFEHFGGKEKALNAVEFILEDRDRVVEEWRNLGFRCWQPQPGGY